MFISLSIATVEMILQPNIKRRYRIVCIKKAPDEPPALSFFGLRIYRTASAH